MKRLLTNYLVLLILSLMALHACKSSEGVWQGQGTIREVDTTNKPIQLQYSGTFGIGNGISASNDFEGARMNGIALNNEDSITVLISPENAPINPSPWYAFKLWAENSKKVNVKLTYPEGTFHRYYPKVSRDGKSYHILDSASYRAESELTSNGTYRARTVNLSLEIGPDTLWIAAQELVGTQHVSDWVDSLLSNPFVDKIRIGESTEGRPLEVMRIGRGDDQNMIMVMALQHPPEIPGYLAMKAFVNKLCDDSALAKTFRDQFTIYVMPMANPDGVARGHWRHNRNGVDINRDWKAFQQVEPKAISDFMSDRVQANGAKFIAALDFHSTWEDIYYTINEELEGNFPGLVPNMIRQAANTIPGYSPNIRPSPGMEAGVTSNSYFFFTHSAEALTYEVGDNTPRDFIQEKGKANAEKLMEILIEEYK